MVSASHNSLGPGAYLAQAQLLLSDDVAHLHDQVEKGSREEEHGDELVGELDEGGVGELGVRGVPIDLPICRTVPETQNQ